MTCRMFICSALLIGLLSIPSHAALLMSEIVFNEVDGDVTGEWIEIYNTGPAAIDLTDYKIGDEENSSGTGVNEAMHRFPDGAMIDAGEVQVVAASAGRFFDVYGILPTYEVISTNPAVPDMLPYPTWDSDGGVFAMGNTNDQALILGPNDEFIDGASWGASTFFFNPPLGAALDGQSYQRKYPIVDTDTANDWEPYGDASLPDPLRSTPFVLPVPEPSTLASSVFSVLLLTGSLRRLRGHIA